MTTTEIIIAITFIWMSFFPAPKSTVILLPDDDGTVGEVFVSNQTGSQVINTAYTAVKVKDANTAPGAAVKVNEQQVRERYKASLDSRPDKVSNYILYFHSGSTQLTPESLQLIPQIITELKSRKIYELYIIGHTDTQGSKEQNHKLGLQRARSMQQVFTEQFFASEHVQLSSHGEGDLLITTADEVDEARNRRVEIEIH